MKKLLNKTFVFTIITLFLIGGTFYWFAYRPTRIQHDCSWVMVIDPAVPAKPAITKEDVEKSKAEYNKCIFEENKNARTDNPNIRNPFLGLFCDEKLKQESPAMPVKSESVWYRKANLGEYNFCIHEK